MKKMLNRFWQWLKGLFKKEEKAAKILESIDYTPPPPKIKNIQEKRRDARRKLKDKLRGTLVWNSDVLGTATRIAYNEHLGRTRELLRTKKSKSIVDAAFVNKAMIAKEKEK